jgi:transposase
VDAALIRALNGAGSRGPSQTASPPNQQTRSSVNSTCAVTVRALIAVITALNEQVKVLEQQVRDHFGRHPDAEVILSQPGMGLVLGARVLAEFGDGPRRCADGKARRNYAGTSPVTRASGKRKVIAARFVHNGRLVDALHAQAFSALTASPGARAFYDQQRASGHGHNDALRRLANRLVGILHGCLKTRTLYDEDTAWGHRQQTQQAA